MSRKTSKIEFGDFQTPDTLATKVVQVLCSMGVAPKTVVEPTCGNGAFLVAALRGFNALQRVVGLDINQTHLDSVGSRLRREFYTSSVALHCGDFFQTDWNALLRGLPQPLLVLGNPPWVTASGLGAIGARNVPQKSNFQKFRGLDARTGKSNFDIAEWMLLRLMSACAGTVSMIAMLVKTGVARRALLHAWRCGFPIVWAHMYRFDAGVYFDVAADACLLVCRIGSVPGKTVAECYSLEQPSQCLGQIGCIQDALIADVAAYEATRHWTASPMRRSQYRWRSGIKHDCAAVMELRRSGSGDYVNGGGEWVQIEDDFVYPLLKGSEVASGRTERIERYLIVPQRTTGQDTRRLRSQAPRTWHYLMRHKPLFDARGSSIYRNRPPFSVFGVGPYTFAPWKIAICGLYKRLGFVVVGPYEGRPVVFDDTVYSIACRSADEASVLLEVLRSEAAQRFFEARVFWDSKRPITAELLNGLDVVRLAEELGTVDALERASSAEAGTVYLF